MKKLFLLLPILGLFSCEKEIYIDLEDAEPLYVIEGNITNQPGPYTVTISQSVSFGSANEYPGVSDARVTITSNDGALETLTEIERGVYQTTDIVGKPGTTYTLLVEIGPNIFEAKSTMPTRVNLDTVAFVEFSTPNGGDNKAFIPIYRDPADDVNYYRFIQTVNDVTGTSYIVFNDVNTNGSMNERPVFSPELEVLSGDSVSIEMRCIDQNTFAYFNTLSQISGANPIRNATPANPPNNIEVEEALGYFSAHTSQK